MFAALGSLMNENDKQAKLSAVTAEAAATLQAFERFPSVVEDYLTLSGTQQTAFGKATGGGIDCVRHIRSKRDIRSSTVKRVLSYIANHSMFA